MPLFPFALLSFARDSIRGAVREKRGGHGTIGTLGITWIDDIRERSKSLPRWSRTRYVQWVVVRARMAEHRDATKDTGR